MSDNLVNKIYDLIYCSDRDDYVEKKGIIRELFPKAVINDASDYIHSDRFDITLNSGEEEYCLAMLRKQMYPVSMLLQTIRFGDPERFFGFIKKLVDEARQKEISDQGGTVVNEASK